MKRLAYCHPWLIAYEGDVAFRVRVHEAFHSALWDALRCVPRDEQGAWESVVAAALIEGIRTERAGRLYWANRAEPEASAEAARDNVEMLVATIRDTMEIAPPAATTRELS